MSRRVEAFRRRLAKEPRQVRAEVLALAITGQVKLSERVVLYGLAVAASRILEEYDTAHAHLQAGMDIAGRRASILARVEMLAQGATLCIYTKERERADTYLARAEQLLENKVDEYEGSPPAKVARIQATLLAIASDLTFELHKEPKRALEYALKIFPITDAYKKSSLLHERLVGISILVKILVSTGSLDDLSTALEAIRSADRILRSLRYKRKHAYRIRVRWALAVICGRLGSTERANALICEVMDHLISGHQYADAHMALETLTWIVAERSAMPNRASYLKAKYHRMMQVEA